MPSGRHLRAEHSRALFIHSPIVSEKARPRRCCDNLLNKSVIESGSIGRPRLRYRSASVILIFRLVMELSARRGTLPLIRAVKNHEASSTHISFTT